MASDASIRASDADRERAAAALREHLAAGRLTIEEFRDRLDRAFTAKTLGDLDRLMEDLPGTDLERPSGADRLQRPPPAGPAAGPAGDPLPARTPLWRPWLAITAFFFVIWLISGAVGGPWFLWPALIVGVILLLRRALGASGRDRR